MSTLGSLVSLWIAHQSSVEACCTSICLITWWSLFSRITYLHRVVRSISCQVLFLVTKTCWSRRPSLSKQQYWLYSPSPIQSLANCNFWPQSTNWIKEKHAGLGQIWAIPGCKLTSLLPKDRKYKASIHLYVLLVVKHWRSPRIYYICFWEQAYLLLLAHCH